MTTTTSLKLPSLIEQMPGICGFKDQNSKFIYANKELKAILGPNLDEDFTGDPTSDPCEFAANRDLFREQDKYVIEKQVPISVLNVHRLKCANWKAYLVVKKPMFDPETQISGVLFHGTDITVLNAKAFAPPPGKQTARGTHSHGSSIDLTPREEEIIFFLLRGGTAKRIADRLSISTRTVEQYIDALKDKFEVPTKSELIERAVDMGYFYSMPAIVRKKCFSKVIA